MNILWISIATYTSIALIAVLILARKVRRQQARLAAMEEQIAGLAASLNALCSSAVGVDKRVVRLERRGRDLEHRQESMEVQSQGEPKPYGEAIQMVHQGGQAGQLVKELGLSQSEAELLVTLHGVREAS
jgi:hypothetical protein